MSPKRCPAVICEHLPDGSTLLFDTRNRASIAISSSAAMVWDACDGTRPAASITAELQEIFDAPPEVVAADVAKLLEDFAIRGLLEPSGE